MTYFQPSTVKGSSPIETLLFPHPLGAGKSSKYLQIVMYAPRLPEVGFSCDRYIIIGRSEVWPDCHAKKTAQITSRNTWNSIQILKTWLLKLEINVGKIKSFDHKSRK